MRQLSESRLGDVVLSYWVSDAGTVGMTLVPAGMRTVPHRKGLGSEPVIAALPDAGDPPARPIDPIVHVALRGDPSAGGWSQGRTMRWSPSIEHFALDSHKHVRSGESTRIATVLSSEAGLRITHTVSHQTGDRFLTVDVEFTNETEAPATVDALSSFSLGGVSPFDWSDSTGRLLIHRLRSAWSAEARPVVESIESLHLERSWLGVSRLSERFGQVGTMPTRGWFPFVAVEDTEAHVAWGAHLAWAGSWQMEIARQGDGVALSGGLADREFGHWSCVVRPGERLRAPRAIVSCVQGDVEDLCDRLVSAQTAAADRQPSAEQLLPIIFNEWCSSWGRPEQDRLLRTADRLSGEQIQYFVIDAGWYRAPDSNAAWYNSHGDWTPSTELFPDGLASVAHQIRARGMTPGLWFEIETVGETSDAFLMTEHLLQRDGVPLTAGGRRFWNLKDPFVVAYLNERVTERLRRDGFGYLKIDYNEHLGLGVDHPDGVGEGLRQQVLAADAFLNHIRTDLPDLVIENCASGGHRLEPSAMMRAAMSSFSDAHELPEIPLIAAGLLRVMLARQMQIWCVLHPSDSIQRIIYSLAATFIGRMCLSGDVAALSTDQWSVLRHAIALYRSSSPIIRDGRSRRVGVWGESYRHPTGWQAVVRTSSDGAGKLIVLHTFAGAPENVEIELGERFTIFEELHTARVRAAIHGSTLRISELRDLEGVVVILLRESTGRSGY